MNYPSNYQTLSAAGGRKNQFDLSRQVVTTSNFGIIKPLALQYCVPGDKHTIDVSGLTRLMPMPSPTFGKLDVVIKGYFVPLRTVMPTFLEFLSMNPSPYGSTVASSVSVPYTTDVEIRKFFTDPPEGYSKFALPVSVVPNPPHPDFKVGSTEYVFANGGKHIYDLLISLGCNINFNATTETNISLLPLFAFWRTYIDWIVPSRYLTGYRDVIALVRKTQDPQTSAKFDHLTLGPLLGKFPVAFLDDDFFTSAWEMPFSNGSSQVNLNIHLPNPSNIGTYEFPEVWGSTNPKNAKDSGARVTAVDDSGYINQYTLMSLGALQDMLNRGILAGTKVSDWLETEFGIKVDSAVTNECLYLGKHVDTIQIGDVMSTSDTYQSPSTGSYLGQYAGKGIGANSAHFDFTSKEHGYLILTMCIVPRTSYYQGLHPEFTQLDRFDFFQPEFDNMAGQAIPFSLLCNAPDAFESPLKAPITNSDEIFGFCPRYADLKTSFDTVSGDFRIPSLNQNLESWFMARTFDPSSPYTWLHKIGLNFCDASSKCEANRYYNIFQYHSLPFESDDPDYFYQIFVMRWKALRPMKSVSEFLKPQHEDDGKPISVSPNH